MFLSTSRDLLFVVLALCAVWLTVFLSWLLYQAGRVLKNTNIVMEGATGIVTVVTDIVQSIHRSVGGAMSKVGSMAITVGGLIEKLVSEAISRKFSKNSSSTSTKTKNRRK